MRNNLSEKNLIDSLLWDVLEKHLNEKIEFVRSKLETCDASMLDYYQATINAYKQLIGLKDIILGEINAERNR